ncbi:hypothetical protein O0882_15055 [Janthinobacterium sp. SUN073]|uniref:hypothetical protein n=1 Tax=Janthinobacterium sp. SUN073 TaxID=3004102 RepID=UPI0025B20B0E|nr:hypothetical protein [Janthinobacterium sp. SUN073]MDN2697641.1 hypothetical protein [Janthinobacterium sp. SUN073]
MATIGVAIASCMVRPIRRAIRKTGSCFTVNNIILDFLNGTVLVPFCLLIGATFSTAIFEEALKSNRLFLTVGGFIGLIFVVREFINGDASQHAVPASSGNPVVALPIAKSKAANSPNRAPKAKSSRRR